jgi:hypothetical protein
MALGRISMQTDRRATVRTANFVFIVVINCSYEGDSLVASYQSKPRVAETIVNSRKRSELLMLPPLLAPLASSSARPPTLFQGFKDSKIQDSLIHLHAPHERPLHQGSLEQRLGEMPPA